jgi:crotonobetainyl-CoA:carnitine CoA-transferase CaiB-like acyl-CoA transferase
MYETMAAFVLQEHLAGKSFVPAVSEAGDRRVLSPSNCPVETADGWLSLTTNTDKQSTSLLMAIGREDLLDDTRFNTVSARIRNIDQWLQLRNEAIKARTTAEWLQILTSLDIPCMPCNMLDDLIDDPHLSAVGLFYSAEHPDEGATVQVRSTILTEGVNHNGGSTAVPLGWNTREVLEEVGLTTAEVDALLAAGAAVSDQRNDQRNGNWRCSQNNTP